MSEPSTSAEARLTRLLERLLTAAEASLAAGDLEPARATAEEVRAVDPDKPRLGEVSFEPGSDDAAACLRIHVPAGHPPGVYNGLLIEEATSRPAGTVSVSITE